MTFSFPFSASLYSAHQSALLLIKNVVVCIFENCLDASKTKETDGIQCTDYMV